MTTATLPVPLADLIAGIKLSATERALLQALDTDRVVTVPELAAATFSTSAHTQSNVQQVQIGRIRRKLQATGAELRIDTVHGRGYRLVRTGGGA